MKHVHEDSGGRRRLMDEGQRRGAVKVARELMPPGYVCCSGRDDQEAVARAPGEEVIAAFGFGKLSGAGSWPGGQAGCPSMRPRSGERILGTEFSKGLAERLVSFARGDQPFRYGDVVLICYTERSVPGGQAGRRASETDEERMPNQGGDA